MRDWGCPVSRLSGNKNTPPCSLMAGGQQKPLDTHLAKIKAPTTKGTLINEIKNGCVSNMLSWWNGRHLGLKIPCLKSVLVRVRQRVPMGSKSRQFGARLLSVAYLTVSVAATVLPAKKDNTIFDKICFVWYNNTYEKNKNQTYREKMS